MISSRGDYPLPIIHHPSNASKKSVAKLWLEGKEDELIGYHSALGV